MIPDYILYSDGACSGNPGPGGYAYIIYAGDTVYAQDAAGYKHTTNNRMELRGVLSGLTRIPPGSRVRVVTDSEYIVNAFTKGWITSWVKKGWRTSQRKPVANQDLWREILAVSNALTVEYTWIRGHAGHAQNELCDERAVAALNTPPLRDDVATDHTDRLI